MTGLLDAIVQWVLGRQMILTVELWCGLPVVSIDFEIAPLSSDELRVARRDLIETGVGLALLALLVWP
jgi:hypothetical protein